jgi:hypothetical protein
VLPTGVNPFVPAPPTPAGDSGIGTGLLVFIIILLVALAGFVVYLCYRYSQAKEQVRNSTTVRGSDVVYLGGNVNASRNTDITVDEQKLLNV